MRNQPKKKNEIEEETPTQNHQNSKRRLKKNNIQEKGLIHSKNSSESKSKTSLGNSPLSKKGAKIIEEVKKPDWNTPLLTEENFLAELENQTESQKMQIKAAKKSPQKLKNVLKEEKQKSVPLKKPNQSSKKKSARKLSESASKANPKIFSWPTNKKAPPLSGLTIVLTGVFQTSANREDIKGALESLGAKVTGSVSGKTSALIHGHELEDGRPFQLGNKYKNAIEKGTPVFSEEEFIKLFQEKHNFNPLIPKSMRQEIEPEKPRDEDKLEPRHELWVDLFAPKRLSDLVGNSSAIEKLLRWIREWTAHPKPGSSKGSFFKAALISGPPGIGKTSAAKLCALACGKDIVIQNASDARNKANVENLLGVLGSNFVIGKGDGPESKEGVVIMDEIDGMTGDRGGVAALIHQIKHTQIPIICICNDRQSNKVRSLANYCLDLKFASLTASEIQAKLEEILSRVHLKGARPNESDLLNIAQTSNGDIRHAISNLQVFAASNPGVSKSSKDEFEKCLQTTKDYFLSLNASSACSLLFRTPYNGDFSELKSLFFIDYNLIPFYVFENYLNLLPNKLSAIKEEGNSELRKIDTSLEFFMKGDFISQQIKEKRDYKLLSVMAFYSGIFPAVICRPHISGWVQFPQMLSRISAFNKRRRLLKELRACFSNTTVFLSDETIIDYSKILLLLVTRLLRKNKFGELLEICQAFDLSPATIKDNVNELIYSANKGGLMEEVGSKSKASFSRFYNARMGENGVIKGQTIKKGARTKDKINEESIKESEESFEKSEDEAELVVAHPVDEFDYIDE